MKLEDDLLAYRATHASARDAIAKCDRLTWMISIAFDAAQDRKAVIRIAAQAGRDLQFEKKVTFLDMVRPFPERLEVIERWAGNPDRNIDELRTVRYLRSFAIGGLVLYPVANLLNERLLLPWLGDGSLRKGVAFFMYLLVWLLLGGVTHLVLASIIRVWVDRLDARGALKMVVGSLAKESKRYSGRLDTALRRTKRQLIELLDSETAPTSARVGDASPDIQAPVASATEAQDFATFRASFPTVSAAIEECTRPDWLVMLALEALPERKDAIHAGAIVAELLTSDNRADAINSIRPWPGPLEAVFAYTGKRPLEDMPAFTKYRSLMIAFASATALAMVGNQYVWGPALGSFRYEAIIPIAIVLTLLLSLPVRYVLAWIVRKQASRLDDDTALRIVMDQIAKGVAKKQPRLVSLLVKSARWRVQRPLSAPPSTSG